MYPDCEIPEIDPVPLPNDCCEGGGGGGGAMPISRVWELKSNPATTYVQVMMMNSDGSVASVVWLNRAGNVMGEPILDDIRQVVTQAPRVLSYAWASELVATGSSWETSFNAASIGDFALDSIDKDYILNNSSAGADGELVSVTVIVKQGSDIPGAPNQVQFTDARGRNTFLTTGDIRTFSLLERNGESTFAGFQIRASNEARVHVIATVRDRW